MVKHFLGLLQSLSLPLQMPQGPPSSTWQPSADIYRTAKGWLIKFDLAGVRPEDVNVTLRGNRLSVRGIRRDWCLEECCHCFQMEISYSQFERHITLPAQFERARVSAEHRLGMLLVRIALEDKPS